MREELKRILDGACRHKAGLPCRGDCRACQLDALETEVTPIIYKQKYEFLVKALIGSDLHTCGNCRHWQPQTGEFSYGIDGKRSITVRNNLCAVKPGTKHTGRLCGGDCESFDLAGLDKIDLEKFIP